MPIHTCPYFNYHWTELCCLQLCFPICKSSIKKHYPPTFKGREETRRSIPVVTNILTLPTPQWLILKYPLSTTSPLSWGFRAPVFLPAISLSPKRKCSPGNKSCTPLKTVSSWSQGSARGHPQVLSEPQPWQGKRVRPMPVFPSTLYTIPPELPSLLSGWNSKHFP